jgi:hypothetical protein
VHGALQAHACLGGAASAGAHLPNGMWVTEHLLSTDRRLASVAWDRTPCKQTGLAVGMGITRDSSPRGRRLASAAWDRTPCKQTGLAVGMGITRDSSPRGRLSRLGSNPVQADMLSGRHGHHPGRLGSNPVQAGRLSGSLHAGARAHGREGSRQCL